MSLPARAIQRFDRGVDWVWKRLPEIVFWTFLVGSVGYLGWLGASNLQGWVGGSGAVTNLNTFRIANGPETWTAPGLTYEGIPGAVLALVEAGVVLFGALLLFARRLRARILGSILVVGWGTLWAANAAAFAAKSGGGSAWLLAAGYSLPLAASIVVTMRRMRSGRGGGLRRALSRRNRRREVPVPPSHPSRRLRLDTGDVVRAERALADANVA